MNRRAFAAWVAAVAAAAAVGLAGCASSPMARAGDASPLARIDAERVVAIADGDFLALTYADQRLAPADAPHRDVLAVWRAGRRPASPDDMRAGDDGGVADVGTPALVDVPNSVTSPPEILALSPDGDTAYVVERIGQRAPGIATVPQLPRGGRLSAIDLRTPSRPVVASTLDLGVSAEALDLRADGRWLAVVSNTAQASLLQLVEVDGARLGRVHVVDLATLGIRGDGAGPRGGVTASAVAWHPRGDALAVNLNTRDAVALLRVDTSGAVPVVRAWGAPVRVGRDPFTGRFTPDGRHYLSLDWGRDFAATSLEGRLPATPSRISVVRLDDDGAHAVTGGAETDRSSEGIAVSPDGRLVATVNMRETAFPASSPRHVRAATISLLALDPRTGALRRLGETAFDGVLPEGATFDRSGRHLLVTVFEYRDAPGGGIKVFAIAGDGDAARAVHVGRLPAPHGTHHVQLR